MKGILNRRIKYKFALLTIIGCIVGFAFTARADVGTPLLWASILHLFIGNAIIGAGEGLLIAWIFNARKKRTIGKMILANYFSGWVGLLFLASVNPLLPMNLNNFWRWFWFMVFVTYCLTLLLEWPFVAWCFRGRPDWFRKSIRASFIAQTASYLILFGWYEMANTTELFRNFKVTKPAELSLPDNISIYYISKEDGNVYRRPLKGGEPVKIMLLHSTNQWDSLVVRHNALSTNTWDLLANIQTGQRNNPRVVTVSQNIPIADGALSVVADFEYSYVANRNQTKRFGTITNASWEVGTRDWDRSLICYNPTSRRKMYLACATVFGEWAPKNPIYLSRDVVMVEFDPDQICAFSPDQRKIALLWRGYGAVAVMDKPSVSEPKKASSK